MVRYNKELLDSLVEELDLELVEEYESTCAKTKINGKCKTEGCLNEFSTTFEKFYLRKLPFCKECSNKYKIKKGKITRYGKENVDDDYECISYNNDLLQKLVEELDFELIDDFDVDNLNAFARIIGKCKTEDCPNDFSTQYASFYKNKLPYCKECVNKSSQEKCKNTMLERYGETHAMKLPEYINKARETNMKRYGVPCTMQNPEIAEKNLKSAYKLKDYKFPSGRITQYQGYENYGYDQLIKVDKINEDDIVNDRINIPEIWYYDTKGIKHRHYVDIYIKSLNKCIEIKSTYTIQKVEKDKIFLKQKAAQALGYIYEIWVYNDKGKRVEIHY